MDVMNIKLDSKLSKAKDTLVDLHKEIATTLNFLEQLKQSSSSMVQKLYNLSPPATCLKEYAKVNAFLLKYISFVTEINCKFEMLQILDFKNYSSTNNKFIKMKDSEEQTVLNDGMTFNSIQELNKGEIKTEKYFIEEYKRVNSNSLLTNVSQSLNLKKTTSNSGNSLADISSSPENHSFSNSEYLLSQAHNVSIRSNHQCRVPVGSSSTNSLETVCSHNSHNNEHLQNMLFSLSLTETNTALTDNLKLDILSIGHPPLSQSTEDVRSTSTTEEENKDEMCLKIEDSCSPFKDEKDTSYEIDEKTDIPTLNFLKKIGQKYKVNVEHIKSPSEFYVHFQDSKIHTLPELEKILKSISKKKFKPKIKTGESKKSFLQKKLGSYVLYYSKIDEVWCRGTVTDWGVNHNNDLVHIFLIDYGESKCVHLTSLRPLPEHLKKYPAFAVKCHLFGICPAEVDESNKTLGWSKESVEKMKSIVEKSKDIEIEIAPDEKNQISGSLSVILWLSDQGNLCVNKLLVERQYAVSRIKSSSESSSDSIPEKYLLENKALELWNPMKEDFESNLNSYDININDPAAVIYGYVGKDYEKICQEFSNTGKCFKGRSCRKKHTFLDPSGFSQDQEEVFNEAFNILPTPETGSIMNVQVTCILQINEFYCISKQFSSEDDKENLGTLVEFMNRKKNLQEMKKSSIPPSVGQMVIAQYSEDSTWYRARVLDSDVEKDEYTVTYVDFGNKETMPLSRIRAMEARYLHLPFQGIYCNIYNIEINPEASAADALNYLHKSMSEGNVNIQVISENCTDQLQLLVKVFDEYGKDIGNDLIEKGYALPKNKTFLLGDSELLPG